MPDTYLIASLKIHDQEAYAAYGEKAKAVVLKFGGDFPIGGGYREWLEGNGDINNYVAARFPSREQALAFYHSEEYQKLVPDRLACSSGTVLLAEGADPQG